MKYIQIAKRALFAVAIFGLLCVPAIADFAPQSPAFPHGSGIIRQSGGCSASTDNHCINGLSFPSFNNFTDSGQGEGINDERKFLVAANVGQQGTSTAVYSNSVTANVGDIILTRAYIHNNGTKDLATTTAHNVSLGVNGFTSAGSGYYYTTSGTTITLDQFTSSSDAIPSLVSDDTSIVSANGQPIRLLFLDTAGAIQTTVNPKTINQSAFVSGGANIGDVKGCSEESFYVYVYYKVMPGSNPQYDLTINKYVGKDQAEADAKTYTGNNTLSLKAGDFAYYRIDYQNLSNSSATPSGTKIYDDYDETKLDITWLPTACAHDGSVITCNAYDLSPGQMHTFYYIAKIKPSVTAGTLINNAAEVKPLVDYDTNDANDRTNARVTIVESAVCGDGATTYPSTTTAYPVGTVFCSKGTVVPANPAFPGLGQTVTWTCQATNGGLNATCEAKRENSTEYDLTIDKYVGKTQAEVDSGKKETVANVGETVTYKLLYRNLSTSLATPVGTRLYDDYDQTKLDITWLPTGCTNDGDKITCVAYDLQPGQSHIFYYVATVKSGVANGSVINNTVEIKPLTDNDTNHSNDFSSAKVTVNAPIPGVCGDAAQAYTATDTQYPPASVFCSTGTAVPATPPFPGQGQTVTWTCQGVNGGSNTTCTATRPATSLDVTIAKSVTPTQTTAGSTVTYTLKYQNLTPGTIATGTVIKDFFDNVNIDKTSFQYTAPAGVTCMVTQDDDPLVALFQGEFIQCTIGNLAYVEGEKTITYTAKIKSTVASGTAINNVAKISATNEDTTKLSNNSANATVTVTSSVINGTCGTGAKTYTATDTAYPAGTIFCATGTANPVTPAFPSAGQTITWTCQGSNGGTNATCSASRPAVTPTPTPTSLDVTIAKSVTPTQTTAGSTVTYTLKYQNLTPGTIATGTVIKDFFDNVNIDKTSFQYNAPAGVSCIVTQDDDPLVALFQGEFIQCTIGNLAYSAGEQTITYTAKIKSTVASGTIVNNVAKISATNEDPTKLGNNSSAASVTVTTGAVNGTCGTGAKAYTATDTAYPAGTIFCATGTANPITPAFPAAGQTITWSCNGVNGGTNATCSASKPGNPTTPPTPTPTVPLCGTASMTYGAYDVAYPSGYTFCAVGTANPNPPAFPAQGQNVSWTCTQGTQTIGCSASRQVPSGGGGGGGGGGGSGGGCNTYSTIDLNITKYVKTENGEYVLASSRDGAVQIAENKSNILTYKVVINNAGDASAYDVVVSDSFSSESGMEQSSITTVSGATYQDGKFKIVQAVGANGKQEFVYTAKVTSPSSAIGKNTAKIESFAHSYKCPIISSEKGVGRTSVAYVKSGGIIDPKEGGYQLFKSADKQVVKAGDIVTYTLVLKNTGEVDMKDVVLSDRFPAEFLEPTEEYTSFLVNDRMLQFKQKFLPAGAEMSKVVKMKVREGVPKGTEIKNTLSAASLNIPMNDTADAIVTVGESTVVKPICPAGYSWNAQTNKCVKKWIKTTPKSGAETPIVALGITFLGLAMFIRRREIAKWMTK